MSKSVNLPLYDDFLKIFMDNEIINWQAKHFWEKMGLKQVRDDFSQSGTSIAEWARDNNFSPDLVYRILKNNKVPQRGESHKIAVKLGIKEQKDMN